MDKFTLNREDTVLLVIDIQEKLVPVMKYKDQVINNNKILISAAHEMNFLNNIRRGWDKRFQSF